MTRFIHMPNRSLRFERQAVAQVVDPVTGGVSGKPGALCHHPRIERGHEGGSAARSSRPRSEAQRAKLDARQDIQERSTMTARLRLAMLASLAITAFVAVLGFGAASAWASFGITAFDGTLLNRDGSVDTQAGSHPDSATWAFTLSTQPGPQGHPVPDGNVKDVAVSLPAGLIGDPAATPECTRPQFFAGSVPQCPLASKVGTLVVTYGYATATFTAPPTPVYNLVPPPACPPSSV